MRNHLTSRHVSFVVLSAVLLAGCTAVPQRPSAPTTASSPSDTAIRFLWPSNGPTLERFNFTTNKGVDIGGTEGDPIVASAAGEVVYAGAGLRGYGNLVIIKHDRTFLTAYAHNRRLFVKEGNRVGAGQQIAEMGKTEADRVKLHFEVRRNGQSVDPEQYLHARVSEPPESGSEGKKASPRSVKPKGGTGSGFAVTPSLVVTNAHVVDGCGSIEVADRGVGSIRALDSGNDLALIEISAAASSAILSQGKLRQGDEVTVVGYPLHGLLAQGVQVTTGNVTALAGMDSNTGLFQISAPVQPGNSGGPVVDASGNVVGVVVSKLNALKVAAVTGDIPQNVNFAVSLLTLRGFLEANSVDYRVAPSTKRLSIADAADAVKAHTVLIKCTPK